MGTVAAGQFSCDACGKTYRWKPELAGRKAKCKCGAVMHCPATEPGKESEEDMYDLAPAAEEPKAARPALSVAPLAATPLPAAPLAATATLAYRAPREDTPDDVSQLMNLWAPMFLIIAAVGGEIGATFIQTRGSPTAIPVAIMTVSVEMIVGTIFMMIGMWLAAKSRQIKLGSFATTMFKLCAIAVAPGAAIDLLAIPCKIIPFFGWMFAWVVGFMLYFALIGTLFELDHDDTWYCVKVIFLLKVILALALFCGLFMLGHSAA